MSFWTFKKRLYVFGGNGEDGLVKDSRVHQIDLAGYTPKVKSIEINGLGPRMYHSTTVIEEDSYSQTILILGGYNEKSKEDNAALVFQLDLMDEYTLLHYFEATGVWWLLGTNQCQDLYELKFGD